MTSYVIVGSKDTNEIRNILRERNLLQESGKLLKLSCGEIGLPLRDCSQSLEALSNGYIEVNGSSYEIYKTELPSKKPYDIMRTSVEAVLRHKNQWKEDLAKEIPKSWVKYGDMAVFDSKSFVDPTWARGGEIWEAVCRALKVNRLARRYRIQPDGFRSPRVEILRGSSSWVTAIDSEIRFSWDVKTCMFCPGNATERFRIGQMDCRQETVVDLYAGIGYFTLYFLVHAKARFVHACEWNPAAVLALRYNLTQNRVLDRCCIHEGDNQQVCPENVADRVNLGLIPACQTGIRVACKALNCLTGGILHLHENVSSYRKNLKLNPPSTSSTPSQPPPKAVKEQCQQCHTLLLNFPKSLMHNIEESFEDGKSSTRGRFNLSFYMEGNEGDVEWCTTSQLVWKKKEWFLQALHYSHVVCSYLSTLHGCTWRVEFMNIHHVKSYAPYVDHLVFDLKCFPVK